MSPNALAREIIRAFEGLRLAPYRCPAGFWTVGVGHRLTADRLADLADCTRASAAHALRTDTVAALLPAITAERAEELLAADTAAAARDVYLVAAVPLHAFEAAALISFVFNLGLTKVADSTLFRRLNAHAYGAVPGELRRWVYGGGAEQPGLVKRREAEAALFRAGTLIRGQGG